MLKFSTFSSISLRPPSVRLDIEMTSRGRRTAPEIDSSQSGPVIGRGRGRVRRVSEIEAGVRPRVEIPREESQQQIGMLSPEMLAMITQAVQAAVQSAVQTAVQTEMTRAREADVARLAEQA